MRGVASTRRTALSRQCMARIAALRRWCSVALRDLDPAHGVDGVAVDAHFPVEVRSGRCTSRPDAPDDLASAYSLTPGHADRGLVPVAGCESAPVIDQGPVAV